MRGTIRRVSMETTELIKKSPAREESWSFVSEGRHSLLCRRPPVLLSLLGTGLESPLQAKVPMWHLPHEGTDIQTGTCYICTRVCRPRRLLSAHRDTVMEVGSKELHLLPS